MCVFCWHRLYQGNLENTIVYVSVQLGHVYMFSENGGPSRRYNIIKGPTHSNVYSFHHCCCQIADTCINEHYNLWILEFITISRIYWLLILTLFIHGTFAADLMKHKQELGYFNIISPNELLTSTYHHHSDYYRITSPRTVTTD